MNDSNCGLWTWTCVNLNGLAPSPRDLPGMVCVDNKLLILGGYGLYEDDEDDVDDDDAEDQMDEEDEAVEDAVDTEIIEGNDNDMPITGVSTGDVGSEIAALTTQIDAISIEETNDVTEDSMDEEVDNVVVDYLNDCFVIDLTTVVCNEISLDEVAVSASSDAPGVWPGRRGCKYAHITDTNLQIMSFGGYDGENFYGLTEIIDGTRI